MKTEDIVSLFKEKNFRATPQRIAVYDYVFENRNHPDVIAVYANVKKQYPAFSKTTVYNALKALEKAGFIIPVMIDGERIRYDADTKLHGHFYCGVCKKIYDFETDQPQVSGLSGFSVKQKDVYYSGICPCCKNK
ncbi:MAG: transcriptional repressor [Eubacterium sp.]